MSRQQVAERCGQSADSLRSYELGRRRPTRAHLIDLLNCLKVVQSARNLILADAGLLPEGPVERFREPNVPMREAMKLIRQRPLPAFLLNERAEILAISGAAWRLFEMREYEHNPPRGRNALSEITLRVAAARLVNWDEVMGQTIQFFKAGMSDDTRQATAAAANAIATRVAVGDPSLMARFVELWRRTPPFRGRLTGQTFPSVWRVPGGTIHFTVYIGCLNTEIGLYEHRLVPADAKSRRVLERLIAD